MSSLTYKSFAVAGTSPLGIFIATELANQGANVVVFTRGSNSKLETPVGVLTKVVDYADADALVEALKGIDVVVSTLSGPGFAVQTPLADAAKRAGVKLFVPSEFGSRTEIQAPDSPLAHKVLLQRHLKSINLPYTVYNIGYFADIPLVERWKGFPAPLNLAEKKLTIVGKGETKISITAQTDIAYFVAYTLTHLPASQLEYAYLGIAASRLTLKEMAAVLEKKYGVKLEIVHRDPDVVIQEFKEKGKDGNLLEYVYWMFEKGYTDIEDCRHLVPGWKPLSFEEAVEKFYPAA